MSSPTLKGLSPAELVARLRQRDRLALARVISKLENRDSDCAELVRQLFSKKSRSRTIGITGPPGAGKSTLVDALTVKYRAQRKTVAILAIDPSSPFTGGALLGDRVRMLRHAKDEGVYIRSLGTRGKQGGLSHASREALWALEAAGFDRILLETAGVGQTELEVSGIADLTAVVLVPESGDSIQMMKAGLLEIADVFVINKKDRAGADRLRKDLDSALKLPQDAEAAQNLPEILLTQANQHEGIDELLEALERRLELLQHSGVAQARRETSLLQEVEDILIERLRASVRESWKTHSGNDLKRDLAEGKIDPISVADLLSGN
jgi:LAO/AO transport system kinase